MIAEVAVMEKTEARVMMSQREPGSTRRPCRRLLVRSTSVQFSIMALSLPCRPGLCQWPHGLPAAQRQGRTLSQKRRAMKGTARAISQRVSAANALTRAASISRGVASTFAGDQSALVCGGRKTSVSYECVTAARCIDVWAMTEPAGLALRRTGNEIIVLPSIGSRTSLSRYSA